MFQVKYKLKNDYCLVFGIQEIRGEIYFLIYEEDKWKWIQASCVEPIEQVPFVPIPYYYPTKETPIDWWKYPYPNYPTITWVSQTENK